MTKLICEIGIWGCSAIILFFEFLIARELYFNVSLTTLHKILVSTLIVAMSIPVFIALILICMN